MNSMKKIEPTNTTECAKIFRIFASKIVCDVVSAIYELKSASVITIKEKLGLTKQAGIVSIVLKRLSELGVVTSKREGKFVIYESVYPRNLSWNVRRCVETILGKRS